MNFQKPRIDIEKYAEALRRDTSLPVLARGRVRKVIGMVVKARLPNARMGELCTIEPVGRPIIRAQVVGFDDDDVYLTPLDPLDEIGPKTLVVDRGESLRVPVGAELLGRVLDSMGNPIDGKGSITPETYYPMKNTAPKALDRKRISEILPLGVRSIDMLFTVGKGQRIGVFSTAGVGKSSLLGMAARNSTADVNVVALVGERGREVRDFLEENLGEEGLKKSVVVVSTSDEPPLRRIMASYAATAIAEYFRDRGSEVLLFMDSLTRFARALREIALSVGELPARQGFPPSVFGALPELVERTGNSSQGSITAIYTVLLSSEQIDDPLGEEIRAILDGHIVLSSRLAHAEHYPAVDVLASNSRLMEQIITPEHRLLAERIRKTWGLYEENRDLISLGAYKRGADARIDEAIDMQGAITEFLVQRQDENESLEVTREKARALFVKSVETRNQRK
jgi:flagellum-specific ATP synthase